MQQRGVAATFAAMTPAIFGLSGLVLTAEDGRDVVVTTNNASEEILFDGGDTNAGDITALASQVMLSVLHILQLVSIQARSL